MLYEVITEEAISPSQSQRGGPEKVYSGLRNRIVSLELPPGTTLARKELADHYNVSQMPVRDALQKLAQEGLVLVYPQSKTIVAPIDA